MSVPMGERFRDALFGSLRFGFRLLPLDNGTRDRWRQRFLGHFPGLVPARPRGRVVEGHAEGRRARMRADQPAIGHVPYRLESLPSPLPATLVAFYLPQFHPIPENDTWWGKGFTEWRNVARALPQFEGHTQPRLPADLGWYDLRNPDTLSEQAQLARDYGIGAFCFYFYWFGGKTLLESPLEKWLADPSIDLPFCLCWANENWSRRWDGRDQDILIAQDHNAADDLAFIQHIARYLRDPRYLRVHGKPLLVVYRPGLLPEAAATAERWRRWCREQGIGEIVLAYVQSFEQPDPRGIGFDAAIEFPPNLAGCTDLAGDQRLINPEFSGDTPDWRELADGYRQRPMPGYRLFPGVNCGWDNEPRRPGKGRTYLHSAPRRYRDWLRDTIQRRLAQIPVCDRFVFINAWNEWAEGAVLEPDVRLGHAWLQATRDALSHNSAGAKSAQRSPCAIIHAWHPDAFDEILHAIRESGIQFRLLVTTTDDRRDAIKHVLSRHGLDAEVMIGANRGRDILPFLRLANRLLDEGEDIVLKLHTKQSLHRDDGQAWRRELLERLLAPARGGRLLHAMREDDRIGMIAPEGHLLDLANHLGGNSEAIDYLRVRLGLGKRSTPPRFVSGSMFWARLTALRPLLDAHLDEWEFEAEQGQIDGTLAHAIERIMALCVEDAGHGVCDAATLCGEPGPDPAQPYPYARRG